MLASNVCISVSFSLRFVTSIFKAFISSRSCSLVFRISSICLLLDICSLYIASMLAVSSLMSCSSRFSSRHVSCALCNFFLWYSSFASLPIRYNTLIEHGVFKIHYLSSHRSVNCKTPPDPTKFKVSKSKFQNRIFIVIIFLVSFWRKWHQFLNMASIQPCRVCFSPHKVI